MVNGMKVRKHYNLADLHQTNEVYEVDPRVIPAQIRRYTPPGEETLYSLVDVFACFHLSNPSGRSYWFEFLKQLQRRNHPIIEKIRRAEIKEGTSTAVATWETAQELAIMTGDEGEQWIASLAATPAPAEPEPPITPVEDKSEKRYQKLYVQQLAANAKLRALLRENGIEVTLTETETWFKMEVKEKHHESLPIRS